MKINRRAFVFGSLLGLPFLASCAEELVAPPSKLSESERKLLKSQPEDFIQPNSVAAFLTMIGTPEFDETTEWTSPPGQGNLLLSAWQDRTGWGGDDEYHYKIDGILCMSPINLKRFKPCCHRLTIVRLSDGQSRDYGPYRPDPRVNIHRAVETDGPL